MGTYFTPIVNNDSRKNDAAIWNGPMAELDTEIVTQAARLSSLETSTMTSATATINNGAGEADTSWVIDNILGTFYDGASVLFAVAGIIYAAEVAATTAASPLTVTAAPSVTIPDNTPIFQVPAGVAGLSLSNVFNVKDPKFGARGDGTTDDHTAITAAITAAEAVNGVVYLPPGTYVVSAAVAMADNTHIVGAGMEMSIIKQQDASDIQYGAILAGTDTSISNISIDCNSGSTGAATSQEYQNGIYIDAKLRVSINNVYIHDTKSFGIRSVNACADIRIENNRFYNWGTSLYAVLIGTGSSRIWIRGNEANTGGFGLVVQGSSYVVISDNVVFNTTNSGIVVNASAYYFSIVGNVVHTSTGGSNAHGIVAGINAKYGTISGNTVYNCDDNGIDIDVTTDDGLGHLAQIAIVGNTCYENGQHGIYVNKSHCCIVTGNVCGNNTGRGVLLSNSLLCTVDGNHCFGSGTANYGISGTSRGHIWGTNQGIGNAIGLTPDSLERAISSISGAGGTVTVDTVNVHSLSASDEVVIVGTVYFDGVYTIAGITDTDTFTITSAAGDGQTETTGWVIYLRNAVITFLANDATPSVTANGGGNIYRTINSAPTTITAFDNVESGMVFTVLIEDSNTTIDFSGTSLIGNNGVDWTPVSGDYMLCVADGEEVHCILGGNTKQIIGSAVVDELAANQWAIFNKAVTLATDYALSQNASGKTIVNAKTGQTLDLRINNANVGQFDDSAAAGNTRFLVYDVDNATLERVTVGAPDSGGAGYKVLRIPN